MKVTGSATSRTGDMVRIDVEGVSLVITDEQRPEMTTAAAIDAELRRQYAEKVAPVDEETKSPWSIHINRDQSVAIAIGGAPDVWPEDEGD